MNTITKIVHQQDAYLKIGPRKSGETSINLSIEITNLIGRESGQVTFYLHKEDLLKALCAICALLPLYKSTSQKADEVVFSTDVFNKLHNDIESFFGNKEEREYKVNLIVRTDGRSYLNDLKYEGLNLRNFLVENHSKMVFGNKDGHIDIRLETSISVLDDNDNTDGSQTDDCQGTKSEESSLQQIYYGAPGTGKSHEVKKITGELDVDKPNVFRTTFHPDTDYASFVGCYKPIMKPVPNDLREANGREEDIAYEFVPQTFTDAYVYAFNTGEPTFLVIEEINRGNCAQIFGDLFQLLDRKSDGTSEYSIKADKDLANYLTVGKDDDGNDILSNKDGIVDGKLCLPANLHILATMNTSDQSLFPIDSAFKRRWDWEYVAIDYAEEKSSKFVIDIDGHKYSWVDFIKEVNKRIYDLTQSEDKQMGNFFIKSSVNQKQFCSKVMFYLWNEVLKDEVENTKYFFYQKKDSNDAKFTFSDLYSDNAVDILVGFMKYLGVEE